MNNPLDGCKADEFVIYNDKAIHGWLQKRKNGYFSTNWKSYYVIVDNQKLCYFTDKELTVLKGVIDFGKIAARMSVVSQNTFQISVAIRDSPEDKVFLFKTQSSKALATWITIINLQMTNAEILPASMTRLTTQASES